MSITYDLDCGNETITLELLDDGTLISYGIDIEDEMIAREMGFEPHPCFRAMDDALFRAVGAENIDVVKILLAAGADVQTGDDYALRSASYHGYADIVKILLEAGADIHKWDDQALYVAVIENHADVVKILLAAGANIHAEGNYALREAKRRGIVPITKILENWIKDHG